MRSLKGLAKCFLLAAKCELAVFLLIKFTKHNLSHEQRKNLNPTECLSFHAGSKSPSVIVQILAAINICINLTSIKDTHSHSLNTQANFKY